MPSPKLFAQIISPWNYPFQLTLNPIIAAVAAGNCVVCKPSEVAPHCARVMGELIPRYLDPECVRVVQGGVDETTHLLRLQWDHIFYTGNGAVARIVMRAAAEHLTPVTLELGGKSPVIVHRSANLASTARRILFVRGSSPGEDDGVLLMGMRRRVMEKRSLGLLRVGFRRW